MLDGDDSVLIVEASDKDKVNLGHFERFGFETKTQCVDNAFEAEYCQSRLVLTPRPVYVRNIKRIISHASVTWHKLDHLGYLGWMGGVADCEVALNNAVPIVVEHFRHFKSLNSRIRKIDTEYLYKIKDLKLDEGIKCPTFASRYTLMLAWGITCDEQVQIEQNLKTQNSIFDSMSIRLCHKSYVSRKRFPSEFSMGPWKRTWTTYNLLANIPDASDASRLFPAY